MFFLFKILTTLTSIATTVLLLTESAQRGMIVLTTVLGLLKIIIFIAFLGVLAVICYLLLRSPEAKRATSAT